MAAAAAVGGDGAQHETPSQAPARTSSDRRSSTSRCTYASLVVVTDRCVNSLDTTSIATPARISSVARLWRSVCGVNSMPVRARSRRTSFATAP